MEKVFQWLSDQGLLAADLQVQLQLDLQPELLPKFENTTSVASISFHGDTVYSPSDLIDLRSSTTLISYQQASFDFAHCLESDISRLSLNHPVSSRFWPTWTVSSDHFRLDHEIPFDPLEPEQVAYSPSDLIDLRSERASLPDLIDLGSEITSLPDLIDLGSESTSSFDLIDLGSESTLSFDLIDLRSERASPYHSSSPTHTGLYVDGAVSLLDQGPVQLVQYSPLQAQHE
ncbi:hypothetical protein F5Y03DRAFT_392573 [Xylaria venustula]|nr:hypothetical protein F5Y03DRAFT_392573 [Xylaria venustula]